MRILAKTPRFCAVGTPLSSPVLLLKVAQLGELVTRKLRPVPLGFETWGVKLYVSPATIPAGGVPEIRVESAPGVSVLGESLLGEVWDAVFDCEAAAEFDPVNGESLSVPPHAVSPNTSAEPSAASRQRCSAPETKQVLLCNRNPF
jgi:hypothetical protein